MKLLGYIAVKKVQRDIGFTFTTKLVEIEPVLIVRSPSHHDKRCHPWKVLGWTYSAYIDNHPELAPDAIRTGAENRYHVHINRALNRKWKPPVFPEGQNWVNVRGREPVAVEDLALLDRALQIADAAMFEVLQNNCVDQDGRGLVLGLTNACAGEVHALAEADENILEAVDWLRGRGYVVVARDALGEHIVVERRPGE